ncbi:MAG: endolytic transglycosylase MltG [Gammaproteobacteria bacterium]|nr:endolytic transglycosylase MltG [Gammaproteobacteria bacterium]MCP5137171.1 endolytic transglycosylase MltG [Gammaproteobacteria bacterium]
MLAVVLAVIATGLWLNQRYQQFLATPLALPDQGVDYTLAPGTSLRAVASDLVQRGWLTEPLQLRWLARQENLATRIRAGEYFVPAGTTPREFLEILISGRERQYAITLLEGWNIRELRAAVAADPILEQTLKDADNQQLMAALGKPDLHPEGRFLPDTYHFPRGEKDIDLYRRAFVGMEQVLAEEWSARSAGLPLNSPDEALTLASIIEKETGAAAERPEIAGVFVRRLQKGMLLQTDPTVIYGLGEGFDGNIRRSDLRTDTPYNTYTRKGLPPTPIAMPGRAAIHAALHPADGKALYFVAQGNGTHYFSATLEEHNAAVRKYQLGGN